MVESDKVPLNIVLLPDSETKNRAITYNYWVTGTIPSEFRLDSEEHRPHLTLVQGEFPKDSIDDLTLGLLEISKEVSPVTIEMDGFTVSENAFVWWLARKSKELNSLYEKVASCTEEFGVVSNKDYSPHITITRLKDPSQGNAALYRLGPSENRLFVANAICLMDMGEHGTVSTLREEMPFKI